MSDFITLFATAMFAIVIIAAVATVQYHKHQARERSKGSAYLERKRRERGHR